MTPPVVPTRRRLRFREAAPTLLLLAVLLAGWQAWVSIRNTEPYILPAPTRIWDAFLQTRDLLPGHVGTTLAESLTGLLFGAAVGAALAVVIASVPLVRRVLWPLLVASQTIPMIVLAPLLVLWFGFGMTPKVVVVALIVFFPVTVSTVPGLTGADGEMVDLVRSMGGSRAQVLRTVLFPAAVPAFFAGLRISAAYAVAGAVIAEWVGASSGLGIFITRSQAAFRVDRVFVAVVIVALLSMALFALVDGLARLASPWNYVRTDEEERP
jgi:ABC-type nitrate/sulfonate/bicarbonate transport system permease component